MFTRRHVIKAAGISFALPWLESLSLAAGRPPKAPPLRYLYVYFGTGLTKDQWLCKGVGEDFKLGSWLSGLEPHKHLITQVLNTTYSCGPHSHFQDYLSGYPDRKKISGLKLTPGAPYSVDQVIADHWAGQGAELHSLALGSDLATKADPNQTAISLRVGAQVPRLVSPSMAFDSLFNSSSERAKDRNILDQVREQVNSLYAVASAADRQRLDQHQTAIRELEKRIEDAEKPRPDDAWHPSLTIPDMKRPAGIPPSIPEYHELMLDLTLLALKMDKTRVATCMINNESSGQLFDFLDGVKGGLHDISHGSGGPDAHARIMAYYHDLFAKLVAKCAAIDEGDGSLLDHSLIQYGSCMSTGGHSPNNIPQLLVGGACGRHKGGKVVDAAAGRNVQVPVGNLSLGVMQKLGLETDKFGVADRPIMF